MYYKTYIKDTKNQQHCSKQNKEKVTKYMIILITVHDKQITDQTNFSLNSFQLKEEKQEQTTLGVKILNNTYSALITD